MKIKKFIIWVFLLALSVLPFCLTSCDGFPAVNGGKGQAKVVGIKLTVYDKNSNVIDVISSVTANEDTKISLNASEKYVVEVGLVQSGGSANANVLATVIVWTYDNEVIVLEKRNDNETDTSYYMECKKANENTNLDIRIDGFSLKLTVNFED